METKIETVIETRTERLKRAIQELRQVDMDVLFPSADSGVEDRAEEDRLLLELKGIVDEVTLKLRRSDTVFGEQQCLVIPSEQHPCHPERPTRVERSIYLVT
jgi:hypothetical protein